VDDAAGVQAPERDGNTNGDTKELRRLHRQAEKPSQRITAGILHQKRRLTFVVDQLQGSSRPNGIQLPGKRIRLLKPGNGLRYRLPQSRCRHKHPYQTSIPFASEQHPILVLP
jgi:hypothetical protein